MSGYSQPDVIIRNNKQLESESDSLSEYNLLFSKKKILFRTDTGIFSVEDGCRIYYSPVQGASNYLLSGFITGWCMCYLFHQRNTICIHSSALSYNGKYFLVSGNSGAGKSTTAMNLIKRGCKYLTDDISFVSSNDNYMVYPGLPIQKICKDAVSSIKNRCNLFYVDDMKDKYALIDKENFDESNGKISVMFWLETGEASKVKHEEIKGFDKVNVFLGALYMTQFFKETFFPINVKAECLKISGSIRVVCITRPADIDTTDDICSIIESYLESDTV